MISLRFQECNGLDLNRNVFVLLSMMNGSVNNTFTYYFPHFVEALCKHFVGTIREHNNHSQLIVYNELAIASKIFNFIFVIIHMHEMRLRLKRFIHMSP